jgi:DNA (cytosine-5)-methyltransferase 1
MRVAALCAGYGGLELGLQLAGVDVDLTWYAEIDKHASQVMAAHNPGVPNLGDLTTIENPPEVDIMTAGFPCQPVSFAGKRAGINDKRWLIDDVCSLARRASANWLILENVGGLLSANNGQALARVVTGLAANGFSAEWTCVRASDVGAPHQRLRWFCIAYTPGRQQRLTQPELLGATVGPATELRECHRSTVGEHNRFGAYTNVVRRWELIVGRRAPNPADNNRQLEPLFVEWMMGLPHGWVTDVLTERSPSLHVLGNGVVPRQAAYAIKLLMDQIEADA